MSLKEFKIKATDISTKGVVAAPDALNGTAEENKKVFDRLIREAVMLYHNNLVDALEEYGVESIVLRGGESKLYLRVNESNHLEASVDGETYEEVSGGHIIEDRDYQRLPDKKFLRFINGVLLDAGASIEVRILPDWNDVEGKPFHGEEVTLFEWSEDYVPIKQVGVNEWRGFYKISNTPMTEQELLECTVSYNTYDGKSGSVRVTEEMIDYFKDTDGTLRAIGADMGDYVGIFVGLEFVSVITEVSFGEQLGIPNLDAGVWVGFDYPGQNDTITKITRKMNMIIDKAVLPPIEADDLPNIPKEKLPAIATEDLPPISWNALTDRPFGDIVSEAKFTTSADMPIAFTAYTAFFNYEYTKVSDLVPSREQLMSAVFTATVDYTDSATIDPNGSVLGYNEQYTQIIIGIRSYPTDLPFIVAYQAGEITMEDGRTFTAPSAGIYLGKQTSETFPNGAVVSIQWEELKKIDERYLPEVYASAAAAAAAAAAESAEQAKNYADSLNVDLIQAQIDGKGDNLWFDEKTSLLYLVSGGEVIGDGVKVATSGGGGTGGGGGIVEYSITLTNLLENRIFSVPAGASVYLNFDYASVDSEGYDDGDGVGTITVDGIKKATIPIKQGENEIDVVNHLSTGTNTVKLTVENSEGSKRSLSYTVKVVVLSISTTLENFSVQSGDLTLYYTPVGDGEKTITFMMDGKTIGTATVTASGRSQSYVIPAQAHGGHILEMYASTTVDEVLIVSDTVRRGIVWTESDNMTPIVFTTFNRDTAMEGETLTIPYMVYDPASETAAVTLEVVDYSSKDLTVGREAQSWVVQDYPTGDVVFKITCKDVSASVSVTVEENSTEIGTVTDSLAFDFNPVGRSNQEDDPASWTDGNVSATFEGVGFSGADGWLTDESGAPMLRILPNSQMTIPYQLFSSDRRDTGVTVEIEMATHNVRDYDSVVLSCLSNERGFKVASQYASLASEQSSISMQFKEDDRVRITFAVEPKALNRLIYVYVDGVMCGAIQYPADDNFQQNPAAGITIGAESSGIDLYRVLLYTKGLTSAEVLDNYIAGRATLQQRLDAYNRNDVLNTAEEIVVSKLPATLPYMVISCAELPQFKGDKKTCAISYVNPSDTARSFTADGVEIDVQGTSSAGYKKKNFKIKLKEEYKLRSTSMPATAFCMKADVASSEGANNVELVRLYNDVVPYKTAPQLADERVRVGIDGLPCVIFWHNTSTGETKFWGKYNFNDEKSSNQVYGLTDGCESWEICNNTSNRVIFKVSDYGSGWNSDFEARFPDKNTNYAKLKRLTDWIVSTDRSAVSSQSAKDARLQKFKDEFEDYFIKTPTLFYYLFTEVFLMVDSRAKNLFPSTFDGTHWLPLPYDMDTALGINNEGALVFDYDLEDTDTVNGSNVFNGQDSVLWCNVRDAFADEIKEMYAELRGGTLFNYDTIVKRFADHQAVWPEVVWNEDAYEKYLEPLLNDNDGSYLSMLQGSKASQREWWLYNGLRYRDSKYQTGDAQKQFITLRCYEIGDITVTPYSHIWPRIKYGSHTVTERGKRNVPTTLINPTDTLTDTEVYIYSADRLIDVGDLSPLMVGYANFSMANKLKTLKLGDGAEGYTNTHLNELYVGNNDLLTTLDVRNCPNLTMTVDLSGCDGLETIEATGSGVKGFTLPVGSQLKTMRLPNTVANLTLRGMKQLSDLTMEGYGNLTTLRIENTPNVPLETIINGATSLERVRLIDVEWTASSGEALTTSINRLVACGGMDAEGKNTDKAVVRGRVYVDSVSAETLATIYDNFPELVVIVDGVVNYIVRYVNFDGTLLHRELVAEGGNAIDPVATGAISAPTREGGEDVGYAFNGWGTLPTNIHSNVTVVAQYSSAWAIRYLDVDDTELYKDFVVEGGNAIDPVALGYIDAPTREGTEDYGYLFVSWDNLPTNVHEAHNVYAQYVEAWAVRFYSDGELLNTQYVQNGMDAVDPIAADYIDTPTKASDPQYVYTFTGWDKSLTNITAPANINAVFATTLQTYTVRFFNGTALLQTVTVPYGGSATYTGATPDGGEDYAFTGWKPAPTNITADTDCYAVFVSTAIVSAKLVQRTISGDYANDRVTSIGNFAFYNCTALTTADFPSVTSIGDYAFYNCTALTTADFPSATSIGESAFNNCTALTTLILRSTTMATLASTTAFINTPIVSGTGYIYVPSALVDSYKAASNWSTYANQFRAIEDYPEICGGVE